MEASQPEVRNNPEANRFEVLQDGHLAVLEYKLRDNRIIFIHTGVPSELEGRGVGSALARAGLEHARSNHLVVVPICPFVRGYLSRHPEYQDLVQRPGSGSKQVG